VVQGGDAMMFYDSDKALADINRMWRRVGKNLAANAVEQSSVGNVTNALRAAKAAEAALWQESGDCEPCYMASREI
jgi:hypothetical protein